MRWVAFSIGVLAVLLFVAAITCALLAIWVVGDDSARFAGTAFVLGLLSLITLLVAAAVGDVMDL